MYKKSILKNVTHPLIRFPPFLISICKCRSLFPSYIFPGRQNTLVYFASRANYTKDFASVKCPLQFILPLIMDEYGIKTNIYQKETKLSMLNIM